MKLYSNNNSYKLYHGNMLDMLEVIQPQSIDSIVTDPPYELGFMGKSWDNTGIAFKQETWKKCYEVLKPGGYLLAFGGSRTFHRIACAIEDAGFEIRDTIMWLYGSGFPKSMNIGLAIDKKNGVDNRTGNIVKGVGTKDKISFGNGHNNQYEERTAQNKWQGWGTALKPSFEPIIVARKPVEGTVVNNVLKWGVGGINIDECRVSNTSADSYDLEKRQVSKATGSDDDGHFLDQLHNQDAKHGVTDLGRFPANTILTYDETDFDEVCGGFPNTKGGSPINFDNVKKKNIYGGNSLLESKTKGVGLYDGFNDSGSASRYFYCAKASKKDRDEGLDEFEKEKVNDGRNTPIDNAFQRGETLRKNTHPTVKPTELMQYLVRLVTPNNGIVLDPFNGSGSTGKAVMYENKERNKNYKYIGIELTEEYLPITKARIEYVCNLNKLILTSQLQIEKINEESGKDKQLNLFELIGS